MTRRRLPTRVRIVIGLVALPALAWSTPPVAMAQAGSSPSSQHVARPPHDPEAEDSKTSSSSSVAHADDDDNGHNDDSCDDANEGKDDSREGDDDRTEHTGTTLDCGPPPVVGEAPLAIGLPIAGAGVFGAAVLMRRRRTRSVN